MIQPTRLLLESATSDRLPADSRSEANPRDSHAALPRSFQIHCERM